MIRTRMLVRIRDRFTCQSCGVSRTPKIAKAENKRLFPVHHLNGLCGLENRESKTDYEKDIDNLITLCHKCHFNHPENNIFRNLKHKRYFSTAITNGGKENEIELLKCLNCLHSWYPRTPKPPKICPKCKRSFGGRPKNPPLSAHKKS